MRTIEQEKKLSQLENDYKLAKAKRIAMFNFVLNYKKPFMEKYGEDYTNSVIDRYEQNYQDMYSYEELCYDFLSDYKEELAKNDLKDAKKEVKNFFGKEPTGILDTYDSKLDENNHTVLVEKPKSNTQLLQELKELQSEITNKVKNKEISLSDASVVNGNLHIVYDSFMDNAPEQATGMHR